MQIITVMTTNKIDELQVLMLNIFSVGQNVTLKKIQFSLYLLQHANYYFFQSIMCTIK